MSKLTFKHKAIMEQLFEMESGYVLGFSNNTFRTFMAEQTDIDVYLEPGYIEESSKAKKLRRFWNNEEDSIVGKVILGLLEIREESISRKQEYDDEFVDKYVNKALEIKSIASEMVGETSLFSSNDERLNADIATANMVLNDLIKIGERVCLNYTYNAASSENIINDYFRDMLFSMGYDEVKDQTRHGVSASGKDAAEVDILLTKANKEIAIFEGLKLNSVSADYIDEHIKKAITNYNALGTATFIVAYVTTADFEAFWNRYANHIERHSFTLGIKKKLNILAHPNASTRVATMILTRDGYDFPVYYLALKMN